MNLILLPFYGAFEALYGSCERWQSDSLPDGEDLCLDKITRHSRGNPLNFMGALQLFAVTFAVKWKNRRDESARAISLRLG
jgi:hypothetical protein